MTVGVDHACEFDCCECGRHIINFVEMPEPRLCGSCLHMPGWFTIPEIRDLLDPGYAEEVASDGR